MSKRVQNVEFLISETVLHWWYEEEQEEEEEEENEENSQSLLLSDLCTLVFSVWSEVNPFEGSGWRLIMRWPGKDVSNFRLQVPLLS